MAKLTTAERRKKLAQTLVSEGNVRVGALAGQLHVSTETIRKDLIYLEKKGIAVKSHGRAVASGSLIERPYTQKEQENIAEKKLIAHAALEFVPRNGAVILDAGSTGYEVAKLLTIQKGLIIFTNSAAIMQALAHTENRVFVLGGEIRESSRAMIGGWSTDALRSIEADVVFLGTDGFVGRDGPTTASYEEVEVKKAMIQSGKKRILLCDYSKFERDDMFQFAKWEQIDGVITDGKAPEKEVKRIQRQTSVLLV